jgi:hypothetical protein
MSVLIIELNKLLKTPETSQKPDIVIETGTPMEMMGEGK